jgi:hypothetical protein
VAILQKDVAAMSIIQSMASALLTGDKAAPALGPPGTGKTFVTFLAVVIALIRTQLTFAWLANGNAPLREVAALLEELVPWDAPLAGLARRMPANNEAGREFAKPTGFDAAYSERPALIPRLRLIVATAHICTQEIRGQVGYDERADVVIVDEAQQAVHFRSVLLLSLLRPGGLTWYVGDPTQPLGPRLALRTSTRRSSWAFSS